MNTSSAYKNQPSSTSSASYAPWPAKSAASGAFSVSSAAPQGSRHATAGSQQAHPVSWSVLVPTLASLCLLILLVLSQNAQLVSSQYTLVKLKSQRAHLLKDQAELKIRLQRLSSLERVDTLARKKLHMQPPAERMVLDLSLPKMAGSSRGTVGLTGTFTPGFSEGSF